MRANEAKYVKTAMAVAICHQNCERSLDMDCPTTASGTLAVDVPVPTLAIVSSSLVDVVFDRHSCQGDNHR